MSIHPQYDVVIVGAGPVGLATAALLKALNKDAKVCVVDKRHQTRRHYGLNIASDSMKAVSQLLKQHAHSDNKEIRSLIKLFKDWSSSVHKVIHIENELAFRAHALGVSVIRNDAFSQFITEENFDRLLDDKTPSDHVVEQELQGYFSHAKVIIGTDGTHSVVRKKVMGPDKTNLIDQAELGYFIEIKYEVPSETENRTIKYASKGSICEGIAFETMGKSKHEGTPGFKPATIHFFVGKTTYDSFDTATNETPWSLEELKQKAKNNSLIMSQLKKIEHYLEGVQARKGKYINAKIKRLPVNVYRSQAAVKKYKGKIVALGGDGYSGAVFARGVNKGFKEAALLAKATSDYLKQRLLFSDELPTSFQEYEAAVTTLFRKEKNQAGLKAGAIKVARKTLQIIATPVNAISLRYNNLNTVGKGISLTFLFLLTMIAIALITHYAAGPHTCSFPDFV